MVVETHVVGTKPHSPRQSVMASAVQKKIPKLRYILKTVLISEFWSSYFVSKHVKSYNYQEKTEKNFRPQRLSFNDGGGRGPTVGAV